MITITIGLNVIIFTGIKMMAVQNMLAYESTLMTIGGSYPVQVKGSRVSHYPVMYMCANGACSILSMHMNISV